MLKPEDIIKKKLQYRCCRREVLELPKIQAIVDECCNNLHISPLHLICCESLTRNFSSFYLMKEPYLIYDSCLMEALYLYDCILLSGADTNDMDKFFYKLYGEELVLCGDLIHGLHFAEKYCSLNFSFDHDYDFLEKEAEKRLSRQNYFLIAHEIAHLSLHELGSERIPEKFCTYVRAAIVVLTERIVKQGQPLEDVLADRSEYFIDTVPKTLDEYFDMLTKSSQFSHFMEECYCDFIGLRMLLEHYGESDLSVSAISGALNYLITQESIRSDLEDGMEHIKAAEREAHSVMYFSVLRVQLLLITLEINQLDKINIVFSEIHDRSNLTDRLKTFVQSISDEKCIVNNFVDTDKDALRNILFEKFYYAHIGE